MRAGQPNERSQYFAPITSYYCTHLLSFLRADLLAYADWTLQVDSITRDVLSAAARRGGHTGSGEDATNAGWSMLPPALLSANSSANDDNKLSGTAIRPVAMQQLSCEIESPTKSPVTFSWSCPNTILVGGFLRKPPLSTC